MSLNTATHQIANYSIATPVYEGPLDLLLQLIERAELDITRLSLAQVTDQFLEYIHQLTELAAEEVSAFLVIAAKLVQIKSEVLLPRPPVREPGEKDPAEALARQLLVYKRYRQIADLLAQREAIGLRTYLRMAPPPKAEGAVDLSDISLEDLVTAARVILSQVDLKPSLTNAISAPRITIRDKIAQITSLLRRDKQSSFKDLLTNNHTRLEIVITFLAMLELVKLHLVEASQDRIFGDIEIEVSADWDEDEDFELEFGE